MGTEKQIRELDGMTCCCRESRIGDKHTGCYYEALRRQQLERLNKWNS